MKPTLVAVLAAATLFSTSTLRNVNATTSPTECKRLPDRLASMTTLLQSFSDENLFGLNLQADKIVTALQTIDTELPWMSQCLGSIDPLSMYATVGMSSGFAFCNTTVAGVMKSLSLPADLSNDKTLRERVCPLYNTTIVPCVNNLLVRDLTDAMNSVGGCCDEMKAQTKALFGTNFKITVSDLLDKLGAAMCSTKESQSASGESTQKTCLSALIEDFFTSRMIDNLLLLAQIPSAQACIAMAGMSFKSTTGKTVQFNWATEGVESFGSCYEPLSELIKLIGSYPLMSIPLTTDGTTAWTLADMFVNAPDKCVLVDDVLKLAQSDSVPMHWVRAAGDMLTALAGVIGFDMEANYWTNLMTKLQAAAGDESNPMCVHFATGQKCTSMGQTSPATGTPATTTNPSTTKPTNGGTPATTKPTNGGTPVSTSGETPAPTPTPTTTANTTAQNSAGSIFLGVMVVLATMTAGFVVM